ncbi:MAG: hypothetical protein Q4C49_05655 [Bacillota bacterium]|nr:hypothetical protein [Bacillota bacterium]
MLGSKLQFEKKSFISFTLMLYAIMILVFILESINIFSGITVLRKIRYIYLICVCAYFLQHYRGYISKKVFVLTGLLLVHTVLFGLVFVNDSVKSETVMYFIEMIIFIALIFFTYYFVWDNNIIKRFIEINYFSVAVPMFLSFITHFNHRMNPLKFYTVFRSSHYQRSTFGFMHANFAGYILAFALIYSMILFIQYFRDSRVYKNRYKIIMMVFLDLVMIDMLFATTSRTAIIAVFIFAGMELFYSHFYKYRLSISTTIALSMGILLILYILISTGILSQIWDSSNRNENITVNMEYFKLFSPMTGMGYLPSYAFLAKGYGFDTWPVDMYYLYILLTTGYFGLFIISLFLVFTFIYIYKIKDSIYRRNALSLFVAIIFAGLGSSHIITYQLTMGMINWIILFLYISPKKIIKD